MSAVAAGAPPLIALVGNPNCGKTALFNLLTGSRQKVANYAGVTVERKEGRSTRRPAQRIACSTCRAPTASTAATPGRSDHARRGARPLRTAKQRPDAASSAWSTPPTCA